MTKYLTNSASLATKQNVNILFKAMITYSLSKLMYHNHVSTLF